MPYRLTPVDRPDRPYRIVQWATGYVGSRAMKEVINHPHMELVGCYVHSPEKVGRDAGELCGLAPMGVKATNSLAEVIALKPDCVLYMQQYTELDQICPILEAGINIVTSRTEFHNPRLMDPAMRQRIEASCEKGGSAIHSTGASPGFITEAMPMVLTSIQRRLNLLTIDEFADLSKRDSPDLIFNVMGYGQDPEGFDPDNQAAEKIGFYHSLGVVAEAMGLPLDEVQMIQEVAAARNRLEIACGVIEKGTVAAKRITIAGLRNGQRLMQMRLNWYCSTDIDANWELQGTGWRVQVDGDAPLDISIRFPVPLEQYGAVMSGYTANRVVNAIPAVCAAEAGIRTVADLPNVITQLA